MEFGSLNKYAPVAMGPVPEQAITSVVALLQEVSNKLNAPTPEMLTPEYRSRLENQIVDSLKLGDFPRAKDLTMRLNLIEMALAQSYAHLDSGIKETLDALILENFNTGKTIDAAFLNRAEQCYQNIIDRMDLDSQFSNSLLVEYLNSYATVLELQGRNEEAQRVHERIPGVMLSMLDQQKTQAAKFCLAEESYWISKTEQLSCQNGIFNLDTLRTIKKALHFYERNEAMLGMIHLHNRTTGSLTPAQKIERLRSLLGSRAAAEAA